MSSTGPSFGSRAVAAFRNLVIVTLVMTCAAAAVWALSTLNARTFGLEQRDGKLVVLKGRWMPVGFEPWVPNDPTLADAYAPIDLRGNNRLDVTQLKYEDRDSLDRTLFGVLEMLAKPRVSSEAPRDLEEGLDYVRRAEKLRGLSEDQRQSLKRMQGDVSFYLARTKLEEAQRQVDEALAQLKLAGTSDNRHTREANQMLLAVEPASKTLSDTLRAAVHSLSTPPGTPAPVPVAPANAPAPAPAPTTPPVETK